MLRCHLVYIFLLITALSAPAIAQDDSNFSSPEAAVSTLYPDRKFVEWVSTDGDLNGDGIKDVAMIIVNLQTEGQREERLIVLAGAPGGKFQLLAASSEYCHAQKFYNLEISRSSLFVAEVTKVDGDGQSSNVLQFRFNKKNHDLELIGRENVSESFLDNSYSRLSVNYLKNIAIVTEREHGGVKTTKKTAFQASSLARLSGFDCLKNFDNMEY